MTTFNEMQTVKRHFFALRNGIVADTYRKAGSNFRIIFGLNLPQIVEIAEQTPRSEALAEALWHNTTTRESMLLAPMIYPREEFTHELARQWVSEVPSVEVADILCHRLLRHMPFAAALAASLADSENDLERYTGLRLMFNLVAQMPKEALDYARNEGARECRLTANTAAMLADEAAFYME